MKLPSINCVHFDWGSGGKCNKLPKTLNIFRKSCPEIFNPSPKNCKLHKSFPKPDKFLPPAPPPCRIYKCYGSVMVRTKESIQKDYEWQMSIK